MKTNKSYIFSLIFTALTVFSGNAWALSESITASKNSYSSIYGTNTWDQTSCTVVNAKAESTTDVSSSNPGRWYKSSTVTFTPKSGYTITKIVLAGSSGSYHGQTMSASTGSCSKSSNTTTWTGSVAPSSYVTLTMGSQFRFGSVTIYYCCQPTSLENTTINATSARLSWSDSRNINSYEVYRSTTNSAPAVDATPTTTVTTKYVDFSNLTANTTYYWWVRAKCANDCKSAWVAGTSFTTPSAAACEATPTVGAVSLNGSFSLTGVGVQCASADPGSNCSIEYYGFVYGTSNASGHPNIADDYAVYNNGAYAANFTNTIVPIAPAEEFTTGQTIYYRGFAMNGNADADASVGYSSAVQSFTPQGVLFYKEKALDNELAYKIVNKGTKVTAPSNPTMTGYTFVGWKNADGDAAFNCATTNIDDDYILYADWTVNQHTLTWSTDGDALSGDYTGKSGKVNYGTTIVAPNNPTKTGYTFKAWSPAVAGTMPDNDVTYTATWTANKYDITYKDQGDVAFTGSHATGYPTQHTYGTATTLSTATKTGYTFGGWFANKECTGEAVTSLGATAYTAGMTLYAKWTIKSCTVEFDKQEGSGGSDDATATYGAALPDITAPTRLHYIFQGYFDAATEGTKYYGADGKGVKNWDKDVTANTTLYAHWTEHTYTNYRTLCCTSWDDPEVSYSSSSISVNGTATVSITGTTHGTISYESSNEGVLTVANDGTITGVGAGTAHVIISWTEADGYCEKTMNSEDITIQGDVTVVFQANNGTEETMENQLIPVSTATALSANEFTAPSCKYFYGWATSQENADNEIRAYEDEEEVTITEGKDLYAIWKTYRYVIAMPTKVGAETATLDYSEVDCNGEVTVTCTADASHKGDPTIEITPSDAGTVNGNKIQNIVNNITAITVTYTAKEVYTVTWKVGNDALEDDDLDDATVSVTEGNGLETLPPNPSGTTLSGADTFMGWSKSELSGLGNSAPSDLFTEAGDEPEINGNVTYHAVFATQTVEESDSWDLVNATANVTEGDYVITCKISDTYYYLKSETVADNTNTSSVGTGLTFNSNKDKLTNTVTANMQWSFTATNDSKWNIRHKKDNTTTYYLGAIDDSKGIRVNTTGTGATFDWIISNYSPDGLKLNASGISRYLTVYNNSDWRYYSSTNGPIYLFKHNQTEAAYENYITKVVALSSIAISAEAGKTIKTVYKKGETLDLTNMVVTATYADATSRAVTGYTVDLGETVLATTNTKFVVNYEENGVSKTAEQAINVYELSGIAITTDPTTTTYKSGATLSTAGMEVTATWGGSAADAFSEVVTGYTVDLSTNLATTDTEFEVSYTSAGVEKTTTKEIHVYDLSGISITAPAKTTYTAGDVFNPAGMVVTATWGGEALDKIVETVDGYTYSEAPLVNDGDVAANVDVTISYTSNGVTKTATQEVTVNPKAKKIMTWHVANEDPFTTRIYVNAQDKYILALPDDPNPVAAGFTSDYVFKGWTTATSVEKDGTSISYASAGTEMSDDEDFYAVFAQKNGEDRAEGYRIVDEAPANGQTVIIARKVSSTYYAMTNSATPGYDALTISNGVISGTTTSYQWSVASATNGVYLKQSSNYLHLNSGALKVANSTDNGDIIFTANNGTYTANLYGNNSRWIIASGDYGFGCGASENAAALYIFKYADATVATYSNYRLVPSTVAVPTGLEAGTYYCASKSITLSQAAGKDIYYTLDGSTPDKNATKYSSAIVLNTSKTIKAVAYDSDLDDYSGVASAVYTIVTSIAAPTMPATQTFYDESMEAEISHDLTSEGAVIHYSYDDASYSNYSDALTIDETKTVYAYATIGELTSPKASATYTKGVTYTYKKVTSDAGLAVGMKFIIVSGTNGAGAMTGSNDYLSVVTVPSPNAQSEIAITNHAVKEFTLSGRSGAYQLVSDQGILGSTVAKSLSYTSGTKTWTISYSGVQVTIENTTTSYGSLKCNTAANPSRFNTYASGQSAIDIYALPFTAHTLTIKNYGGTDKTTAKVVEGGSFVLTDDDKPSGYPGTYEFLNKWTDGINTYAVGDAVEVSAAKTLQPCWKVTPTANVDINTLPTSVTEIVVEDGKTLTIGADRNLDNLTVEAGGKVELAENKLTVVGTFTIETTMASGNSGQLNGATASNFEAGEAYIDITLGDNGNPEKWHAFTVPFPVDAINGIYDLDGNKLANEVNYAIMDYHGDIRATGNYGWKKFRGIMTPGTFYLMTVDGSRTTYRFMKTADGALVAENTMDLKEYAIEGNGEDGIDNGWNGVGNPTLRYGQVGYPVQVLNPTSYTYEPFAANAKNFIVGTPFFIQANAAAAAADMTFGAASGTANYAPARTPASEIKDIEVSFGNEEYSDRLYISASEDALNQYETGKDLVKMTMTNTPSVAQIFGKAYNTKLCMVYAPLSNDQAVYDLTLYAPQAGEYTIAAPSMDNADLYLTYEGSIIWNLSMNEYVADFAKGNNEGYGLLLVRKTPNAATGVDEVTGDKVQCTKVVIDDHVYILRGEQLYGIDGKMVK